MIKELALIGIVAITSYGGSKSAFALDVPITASVTGSCVISTETAGTYGQPNAYTLTTAPSDGGQMPITRVDTTLASAYKIKFTVPNSFSSSPNLNDVVTFTGDTEVSAVSDATGMADYETDKVEVSDYVDEYDLTATGSTWFKHTSVAVNGGSRAFPSGNYTAYVTAECIAL
jgi:hypothetical protein